MVLNILEVLNSQYSDPSTTKEIIHIVLSFLAYCKNEVGYNYIPQDIFTENYPEELGTRWLTIKQEIFDNNKSKLKVLSYIVKEPQSGRREYEGCFQ